MVSFQCDGCADTVKKPKLDQHRQRCWASFTCLDCSKTFQNQEYKAHTSCISEAEKYQGALYKGPKKGQQTQPRQPFNKPNQNNFTSAPPPDPTTEPTTSAPAIHPSRLVQIESSGNEEYPSYGPRGGFRGRGRGGFGGYGGRGPAPVQEKRVKLSGENTRVLEGGMRSWGSSPMTTPAPQPDPTPSNPSIPPAVSTSAPQNQDDQVKKRKKKGDKGGTGSKANSKRPKEDVSSTPAPVENGQENGEPALKKRKRSSSPSTPVAASSEISDKTLKKLRKNAGKIAEKIESKETLALQDWLKRVSEGKKDSVGLEEVKGAAKVSLEDGKWVISF